MARLKGAKRRARAPEDQAAGSPPLSPASEGRVAKLRRAASSRSTPARNDLTSTFFTDHPAGSKREVAELRLGEAVDEELLWARARAIGEVRGGGAGRAAAVGGVDAATLLEWSLLWRAGSSLLVSGVGCKRRVGARLATAAASWRSPDGSRPACLLADCSAPGVAARHVVSRALAAAVMAETRTRRDREARRRKGRGGGRGRAGADASDSDDDDPAGAFPSPSESAELARLARTYGAYSVEDQLELLAGKNVEVAVVLLCADAEGGRLLTEREGTGRRGRKPSGAGAGRRVDDAVAQGVEGEEDEDEAEAEAEAEGGGRGDGEFRERWGAVRSGSAPWAAARRGEASPASRRVSGTRADAEAREISRRASSTLLPSSVAIPDGTLFPPKHLFPLSARSLSLPTLARLAALPNVRLAAVVDHVDALGAWDGAALAAFRWAHAPAHTLAPRLGGPEARALPCLLVPRRAGAGRRGARAVLSSLAASARAVFGLLLDARADPETHPAGLPFDALLRQARERFLVSSDAALKRTLAEFFDHGLVVAKRANDGTEGLWVTLAEDEAAEILEEIRAEEGA